MLRAALKLFVENRMEFQLGVAPHKMLRAALKLNKTFSKSPFESCTTYNAACGIETFKFIILLQFYPVAPHIMLRAALKPDVGKIDSVHNEVAPHKMLRAALKHRTGVP